MRVHVSGDDPKLNEMYFLRPKSDVILKTDFFSAPIPALAKKTSCLSGDTSHIIRAGEFHRANLYSRCGELESENRKWRSIMVSEPVELDGHRGMAAQKSTELRRRSHEVEADQAALRDRQEQFERQAIAGPSTTWAEAAAKARYLIQLFAATPEARDPRRQELISKVLDDLTRLSR